MTAKFFRPDRCDPTRIQPIDEATIYVQGRAHGFPPLTDPTKMILVEWKQAVTWNFDGQRSTVAAPILFPPLPPLRLSSSSVLRLDMGERRLPDLVKFPRTRHLLDLGGGTRDDLSMTQDDARAMLALGAQDGYTVAVEEKVDGANLGFSVGADGRILAQNRSHYVNSASHAQFRLVNAYVARYGEDIRRICAGGRVLYGEWLYATHSVEYSSLPSNFLAFDVYDAKQRKFLSRAAFHALLGETNISVVPQLPCSHNVDDLERIVRTEKSRFADTPLEGVYVRLDQGAWLVDRAKVVRPGFITGNKHWSSHVLRTNRVVKQDELYFN